MNEFKVIMNMCKDLKLEVKVYKSKKFIAEDAIKDGAKFVVCIRGSIDLAFNTEGQVIGHYTNSYNSWVKRT